MDIEKTKYSEIEILKSWFADKESSYYWCGPGLRYPFTHSTFLEDIHWEKMATYSLLSEGGQFIGFGQYYEKAGRCHLARLVVSPHLRTKGVGRQFILQLMSIGMADLNVTECSLFVVDHNQKALGCYRSLGFKKEQYPPDRDLIEDIEFMVYRHA